MPENVVKAKQFLLSLNYPLPRNTVQLVTFDYATFENEIDDLWLLLDATERESALKFVFPQHKVHYIITHGVLRILLGHYTQQLPQSLVFAKQTKGKPYFADPLCADWHFNLSHSKTGAAIAVSFGEPIGIDIEWMKPNRELLGIAQRFFATSEAATLSTLPEAEQQAAFYRLWTYKEAVLKATGAGITEGVEEWIFELDESPLTLLAAPSMMNCHQWSFFHQHLPQLQSMLTAAIATPDAAFMLCQVELQSQRNV